MTRSNKKVDINNTTTTNDANNPNDSFKETKETKSDVTQKFIKNEILSLKEYFFDIIKKQKEELIRKISLENTALKKELLELKDKDDQKSKRISELENEVIDLQQYIRRNNVEICGIPEDVSQNDLEKTVLKIAESIGVYISSNDIEACHRLNTKNEKSPKKTIVRFVNRKFCDQMHLNKFKLRDNKGNTRSKLKDINIHGKIFINSNLCPYFKFIWGRCKRIYDQKMINRFWVYNGFIFIALEENSPKIKINHLDKLKDIFPDFNFE